MSSKGLLFVYGEPGSDVAEREFNDWYDNDHAPARLTVPGIQSALRYKATDSKKPSYLAIYDAESSRTLESDAYKSLALGASDHERTLIPKLEVLNRRIYDLVEARNESAISVSPFIFVVTMSVPPELDAEFNRWYTEEHNNEFAQIKGWRRCRRYRSVTQVELGRAANENKPTAIHNYLTIHDFDIDDYDQEAQFNHSIQTPWSKKVLPQLAGVDLRKFILWKELKI